MDKKEITVFIGDVMIKGSTKGVTGILEKLAGREPKDWNTKTWVDPSEQWDKKTQSRWTPDRGSGYKLKSDE